MTILMQITDDGRIVIADRETAGTVGRIADEGNSTTPVTPDHPDADVAAPPTRYRPERTSGSPVVDAARPPMRYSGGR